MKVNKWTLGLAAVGLVSLPAALHAEEQLSPVQTALNSTVISGYVNTSAQWDFGTGNYGAPSYAFNQNKQDGFNLNAVKLSVERPFDDAQWAAAYKVDLMFGPDADAFGTTLDAGGNNNFAVRQAYVGLRAPVGNGLDFKLGVFDSILGYESTDAGSNPNMTRSWGYTIEPVSHTGLLTTYKINDMFKASAYGGVVDPPGEEPELPVPLKYIESPLYVVDAAALLRCTNRAVRKWPARPLRLRGKSLPGLKNLLLRQRSNAGHIRRRHGAFRPVPLCGELQQC